MDASGGRLVGEVSGEVEKDDFVLIVRRIHVAYVLRNETDDRDLIERVHAMHKEFCPIYRSIYKSIDIGTTLEIVG